MKYAYVVTRISGDTAGSSCSEHKTFANAEKAIGRYVAMSNGKLTASDFRIDPL